MQFFFDESGDYGFRGDDFDAYIQAVLICPELAISSLEEFTRERCAEWGVDELHATELDDDQRQTIAEFIGASDCTLLAHVTDNVMVTSKQIADFRLAQAAKLRSNLDVYRRESTRVRGAPVKEIEDWYLRQLARAGLASRVSDGEFIQSSFLIGLVLESFKKSLIVYLDDEWRESFQDFHFILDSKLPNKMAAGEKLLNDTLVPALGSMPNDSITTVDTWRDEPVHPFVHKFSAQGGRVAGKEIDDGIDLKMVFEHGLEFVSSHENCGVQLADSVAHLIRRGAMDPADEAARAAYERISNKLRNGDGQCLTLQRLNVGEEDRSSIDRYRPLYHPTD